MKMFAQVAIRAFVVGLFLVSLSQALAGTPEAVPVAKEFQEKVDAVVEATAGQSPADAVDFPPCKARFVRVMIRQSKGNSQPCIDELEIFGPDGKTNLALAESGAKAGASSLLAGYPIHQIAHLNDGKYGNDHSWIAASTKAEWAQIELPKACEVARVIVTRDRTGGFTDRIPEVFDVLVSEDGHRWNRVAQKEGRANRRQFPYMPIGRFPNKSFDGFLQYTFQREKTTWSHIPADDHLSPLVVDRPAKPGGKPYWSRVAKLAPLDRVLVLFEEMIDRLDEQGLDVSAERAQAAAFRAKAKENPDSDALYMEARRAKRALFLRDPALEPMERILFTKRHPYLESHNYSEHLDGILAPGGGVCVLNIPRDEQGRFRPDRATIETLFDGSEGIAREAEADYDAQKIYFSYRPDTPEVEGWASYWHMYSMNADGSELKQLTEGPFHDFDACCLPDGKVAFMTTRCAARFLCWRPQAYVLFRMDADGSNITRLSHANLSEWKPSVMKNGRILWTRSEYLDKGADFGHTLWAIRPDGTHPELIFGNNTPNCYSQAHEVPGTNEIVCTLMSHGDHKGPTALIDRGKDPFDTAAITNITPDTRPQYQMARSHHNTFRDPYPISKDHFLVTHNPDDQHNWALYVIDRYGNREVLYADPLISSKHPRPLRARPRPPVLSSPLDSQLAKQDLGQFTVQDVYRGLGSRVERGRAKYLRVAMEVPADLDRLPDGQCRADHPPFTDFYASPIHLVTGPPRTFQTRTPNAPAGLVRCNHDWPRLVSEADSGLFNVREEAGWPSYVAKASLGTVPIAEDGSVSFLAPARKVLYFQLLDGDYNELQRMRSVIQLQAGERRSCIGCHENRHSSAPPEVGLALLHAAKTLEPPPWGTDPIDYRTVVQPVLDSNCVRCHDGTEKGRCDLRGTLGVDRVPRSYRTLIEGGWVHYFDFTYGMRHFKAEPLSFGTVKSALWDVLKDENHKEVSLTVPEMRAIKAWTDMNCPLWPDYIYRPERPGPEEGKVTKR